METRFVERWLLGCQREPCVSAEQGKGDGGWWMSMRAGELSTIDLVLGVCMTCGYSIIPRHVMQHEKGAYGQYVDDLLVRK
jgi:hypothetical protein